MELRPEDRGWNDPPIVNFNEAPQGVRRGKLLNKRVAFPINGSVGPQMGNAYPSMQGSTMQSQPMPVQVGQENYMYNSQGMTGGQNYYPQHSETYYPQQQPQMGEYPQPNQSPNYMQGGSVEQPQPVQYHQQNVHQSAPLVANDSMLQLDEAIRNFHDLMNNLSPETLNKEEVGNLLQILQSMWREHKLTPEVQDMTFQLSVALCNGDGNYAESLVSSLSVNHYDTCGQWISGPRALLQAAMSPRTGI